MQIEKLNDERLKKYENRTQILKAMAHPTRLYILDVLTNGPLCVCEINDLIDADVSTISKHISLLHKAGLVSRRKDGLKVYYKLERPCLLEPFSCIEKSNKEECNV